MLGELLLTTGIVLIAYAFYVLSTKSAKYFEDRNLKYIGVGGFLKTLALASIKGTNFLTMITDMYNAFPDVP